MNPSVANHFFEEIKEVAGFLSIGRVLVRIDLKFSHWNN